MKESITPTFSPRPTHQGRNSENDIDPIMENSDNWSQLSSQNLRQQYYRSLGKKLLQPIEPREMEEEESWI